MKIVILGSGAAVPSTERNVSSVAVEIGREGLLIDCGEGTQLQLQRYHVRWGKINHIFISHLHGDHYFGLPGLLFTWHLYNRRKPLHLYCPPELMHILDSIFKASATHLCYRLEYHLLNQPARERILDHRDFTVDSIPLTHRIDSHGFLITSTPGLRHIRRDFLEGYNPDRSLLPGIQKGNDYLDQHEGRILNEQITRNGRPSVSFAYVSDTSFQPEIAGYIQGVNLLYHEATFAASEAELARQKGHSTSVEAATIAQLAQAGQLVLGHLSPRIASPEQLAIEARALFPNTLVANDGDTFII